MGTSHQSRWVEERKAAAAAATSQRVPIAATANRSADFCPSIGNQMDTDKRRNSSNIPNQSALVQRQALRIRPGDTLQELHCQIVFHQ